MIKKNIQNLEFRFLVKYIYKNEYNLNILKLILGKKNLQWKS